MNMTDNRNLLTLTPEEKQDLERWAPSRTLPAGDVFRARLILALAEGQSYREIAKGMRTSAATIARWRTRFSRIGWLDWKDGIRAASPVPLRPPCRRGWRGGCDGSRATEARSGRAVDWPVSWE